MIRQLRQELGKSVPCVPCRDAGMTQGKSTSLLLYYYLTSIACCHTTQFGTCDHFDLFDITAWTRRPTQPTKQATHQGTTSQGQDDETQDGDETEGEDDSDDEDEDKQ
jgi:hypothetical protein